MFLKKSQFTFTSVFSFSSSCFSTQRERPDGWRDVCIEEGDRIYYPHGLDLLYKAKEEIVANKDKESKEGVDELGEEIKVFDLRKR